MADVVSIPTYVVRVSYICITNYVLLLKQLFKTHVHRIGIHDSHHATQ